MFYTNRKSTKNIIKATLEKRNPCREFSTHCKGDCLLCLGGNRGLPLHTCHPTPPRPFSFPQHSSLWATFFYINKFSDFYKKDKHTIQEFSSHYNILAIFIPKINLILPITPLFKVIPFHVARSALHRTQ